MAHFHRADGKGYEFFADQARPDILNIWCILIATSSSRPDLTITIMSSISTIITTTAITSQVLACKNNPQLAARLLTLLSGWSKLGASRRELMKGQLERIRYAPTAVGGVPSFGSVARTASLAHSPADPLTHSTTHAVTHTRGPLTRSVHVALTRSVHVAGTRPV